MSKKIRKQALLSCFLSKKLKEEKKNVVILLLGVFQFQTLKSSENCSFVVSDRL